MALKDVPLPPIKANKKPSPTKVPKTKEEKEAFKQKHRIGIAKREIRAAERKLAASRNITIAPTEALPAEPRAFEEPSIIFSPNPGPQTQFLSATEREVLYGGAAGGGKSYALIADPLRYAADPGHRAILFRRTNDELREIIFKSKEMYSQVFKSAKWSEQKSTWTFPSGATIWFTYLDRDDDVLRYQGQAFNWVGFDELTQWPTPFPWNYMRSRLRTTSTALPLHMRATTNPGNVGAKWVRSMFLDPAPWGERFPATDLESGEVLVYPPGHAREGEPLFDRRFIPARLSDNPYLYESGEYEANLLSLPEAQRRQLLEGDWDAFEGAAFPEFRRSVHVCEPFEIPQNWTKFRAADWGYRSPACCLWFAVDYDGNLYVYRELYTKLKLADEFARMVLDAEWGEPIRYGVLDASAWATRGDTGPSIAETMIKEGCSWRPSDRTPRSRVSGKMQVHYRLREDEYTLKPRLTIFSNCVNLIRTMPALPVDKNNAEDVDTTAEDHAYDALRYGCASRPINPNTIADWDAAHPTRTGRFKPVDTTFGY